MSMSKYPILPNSELIPSKMAKLGKCHFLPGGVAPENWGDQVLCLRSKGGIKRFFQIKRGDHSYFLKK